MKGRVKLPFFSIQIFLNLSRHNLDLSTKTSWSIICCFFNHIVYIVYLEGFLLTKRCMKRCFLKILSQTNVTGNMWGTDATCFYNDCLSGKFWYYAARAPVLIASILLIQH